MFAEEFNSNAIFIIGTAIGLAAIVSYIVCYVLSKKHRVWIVVALVLFSIDTLFMLWVLTLGFDFSIFIEILFHSWIMYYLIVQIKEEL